MEYTGKLTVKIIKEFLLPDNRHRLPEIKQGETLKATTLTGGRNNKFLVSEPAIGDKFSLKLRASSVSGTVTEVKDLGAHWELELAAVVKGSVRSVLNGNPIVETFIPENATVQVTSGRDVKVSITLREHLIDTGYNNTEQWRKKAD